MLRTRQSYIEIDAAKANSSQFGGLPALTAVHVAALAAISIDASRLPVADAVTMADAIIKQNAALASADPSKSKEKKGKGISKGKGGKGKGKGGKDKGKGKDSTSAEFVIPRDADGKVNGWITGMSPCWCKKAGLDDGKHIFEHCKYDEHGNLKTANVAAVGVAAIATATPASTDSTQQIAALAAAVKKVMESQSSYIDRLHLRHSPRQVGRGNAPGGRQRHHGRCGHDLGAQPLLGNECRWTGWRRQGQGHPL